MATWDDVRSIALALPETAEPTARNFRVNKKLLAWERPLRRSDLEALGDAAPKGHILGVWVPDLDTKEALLAARPRIYFTTPHFDGYPAVLVRLGAIGRAELRELLTESWRHRAPLRAKRAIAGAPSKRAPDKKKRRSSARG